MVLKLYKLDASPPVRSVLCVIELLEIPDVQYENVNLVEKEQFSESFLKINPQHTVPTLVDDDFVIIDSHAIVTYLISKYGKDDSLYPTDLKKRAIIDHKLHFDSGILFPALRGTLEPVLFWGEQSFRPENLEKIKKGYDFIENFLTGPWLAGDELTVADICCVTSISSLNEMVPIDEDTSPAKRVGCGGMHRIVLLMAVLTRATAPQSTLSVIPGTEVTSSRAVRVSTLPPPTVFRSMRVTMKPQKQQMRKSKGDSPMLNYIFDSYATSNKHFHDKFKAPSFEGDVTSDTVLDADTGATVSFDCRVSSLRDKTVSWIRVSDDENIELLTLDLDTHTTDARYRVDLAGENWKLALFDAKFQDSGIYCCHVSTHPPMLRRFKLTVHSPEIRMNKETFLESGETLSLKCSVLHLYTGEVVPELRWYRGNNSTPLDETRGGVLIETDHLTLTSHLQVARLKPDDAGNYTCALEAPFQMKALARVHVLQGSSLAELQSGVKTTSSYNSLLLASMVALFVSYGDVR